VQLVLTVGKNPLPVALSGLFFREQTSDAYLVHSPQAQDECYRIPEFWKRHDFHPRVQCLSISPEPDPDTERKLRVLPVSSLHFHYSGGTTAMALAVARARPKAETSYLSLHSNRILDDHGPLHTDDLRLNPVVRVSLEELMLLHGFVQVTHCNRRQVLPPTGRLAHLADMADTWRAEIENKNQPNPSQAFNYDRISGSDKPAVTFRARQPEIARAINAVLAPNTFQETGEGWMATLAPSSSDFWDFVSLFKTGGAFELKVKRAFEAALEDSIWRPAGVAHGLHLAHHERVGSSKDTFEADLLAVLGYQLVYVSCTTGTDAKGKAFEALHRARQLGGLGTRALVIASNRQEDKASSDEALLHLEIGLPPGDRSLRILRVDTGAITVNALTDQLKAFLSELAPKPYTD
jgi:hypothetical protein